MIYKGLLVPMIKNIYERKLKTCHANMLKEALSMEHV